MVKGVAVFLVLALLLAWIAIRVLGPAEVPVPVFETIDVRPSWLSLEDLRSMGIR